MALFAPKDAFNNDSSWHLHGFGGLQNEDVDEE